MARITENLILSEPIKPRHGGAADSSGSASNALVYLIFAAVALSSVAAVLILKRTSDGEQKRSLLRVLAVVALATVAVIGAVVSVSMCLDSLRVFFS